MKVAESIRIDSANRRVNNRDTTIILTYLILAILLLVGIYEGSASPGTATAELASMSALP